MNNYILDYLDDTFKKYHIYSKTENYLYDMVSIISEDSGLYMNLYFTHQPQNDDSNIIIFKGNRNIESYLPNDAMIYAIIENDDAQISISRYIASKDDNLLLHYIILNLKHIKDYWFGKISAKDFVNVMRNIK